MVSQPISLNIFHDIIFEIAIKLNILLFIFW